MKGDLTKLPKWAQYEFLKIQNELKDLRAQATVGPEGSDTFLLSYDYSNGTPSDTPLGKGVRIGFGARENRRASVDCRWDDGALQVMGTRTFTVKPKSGNYVEIRLEEI